MIPIYILKRVPGADPADANTVEWETICHSREPFVMIRHDPTRERSRWVFAPRKRPFTVCYRSGKGVGWAEMSHHATIDAARKAAVKVAKEMAVAS